MALSNSLNAGTTGIVVNLGTGSFTGRTLTGTANQIAVSNGDGVAGNPTFSLTNNINVSGISFDSGSNTLSAYSTGTFSPTLTASSSNPTVGYSVQVGTYERIGSKVMINAKLILSAISGGSGQIQLDSLPFTTLSTTSSFGIMALSCGNITFETNVLYYQGNTLENTTFLIMKGVKDAGGFTSIPVGNINSNSSFIYGSYYNI